MNSAKRYLTLAALVFVAASLMSGCSSDEPRSVTTTDRTVTHFDDGSSRSSTTTTTESRN